MQWMSLFNKRCKVFSFNKTSSNDELERFLPWYNIACIYFLHEMPSNFCVLSAFMFILLDLNLYAKHLKNMTYICNFSSDYVLIDGSRWKNMQICVCQVFNRLILKSIRKEVKIKVIKVN